MQFSARLFPCLFGPPTSTEKVLQNRICPSVLLSVLASILPFIYLSVCKFSRNQLISFFLKFSMVLGVFGLFRKIASLVLSGICVKRKFSWFINILWKLNAWEKSGSQVIAKKWLLVSEISVFFNLLYFIKRLISDFDFWHVYRHDGKEQVLAIGFLKEILIWANGPFWAPKLCVHVSLDPLKEFF